MGQFWAGLVRMEDRRECSDKKIVSRCRGRTRRVYYGAVFEIKKEIPVKMFLSVRNSNSVASDGEVIVDLDKPAGTVRQVVRYVLHLAAVYAIVNFTTMWLAGRVHDLLLPLIQQHPPTVSYFQFAFSHLFLFSFFPAILIGFPYAQWYPHRVALFVWIVPLAILVYKIIAFPTTAFEDHWTRAFHEYFGGGFLIPEFHSYRDLFQLAATPDALRGMQQFNFTAPFYAAIGYSIGTWLGMRCDVPRLTTAWRNLKPTSRIAEFRGSAATKTDFKYIYVNQDGTVRELSPREKDYLSESFSPADSGRPYIKRFYEGLNGWGSMSGFMLRRKVPSKIRIQPVNPSYDALAADDPPDFFSDHITAGDIVVKNPDGSGSVTPNPNISLQDRVEILRRLQLERELKREQLARHPDYSNGE